MTLETAYALIAMLLVMALIGLLARRVNTPYPVMLVMGGVALTFIPGVKPPPLDPNLILLFFLPPLLYKEAFHTSWHDFVRWLRPILMLAVGLVAATVLVVGLAAKLLLPDLPWAVCFILGAVISPTDTVAATAVIHRLRVPRRLTAVLGGESLVNDATGLVALQLAIGVVLSGAFSWIDVGVEFAWTVVAGVAIGLVVGAAAHFVNRVVRDTLVLFTFSIIAPYVAFAAAHAVHASGVIAVVVCGFFVAWRIHSVAADTRYQLFTVWRLLAYLIDGFSFVLIGVEVTRIFGADGIHAAGSVLLAGAVITVVIVLIRALWVFPGAYLPLWLSPRLRRHEGGYPPVKNVFLASWCGMRGAVSLAAALSVPMMMGDQPFPGRDDVIACTIIAIIGTLIVQGLTLSPLIKLLGIRDDAGAGEEERLARISMIQAALSRLDELRTKPNCDERAADHVETAYMERLRLLIDGRVRTQPGEEPHPDLFTVELEALHAERQRVLSLRDKSNINDMTQSRLQEELDIAEMRLRSAEGAKKH